MLRFRIRTNWTNSVSKTYEFGLDDLTDAATRDRLKWAFSDPERLRPGQTRQSLAERAAPCLLAAGRACIGADLGRLREGTTIGRQSTTMVHSDCGSARRNTMRILMIAAFVAAFASASTAQEDGKPFDYKYRFGGAEGCKGISFLEDADYILMTYGQFTSRVEIRKSLDRSPYPYKITDPGGRPWDAQDAETAFNMACQHSIQAHMRAEEANSYDPEAARQEAKRVLEENR